MSRVILVDQRHFAALRIPLLQDRIWNTDENTRGDFIAVVNRDCYLLLVEFERRSATEGRRAQQADCSEWMRRFVGNGSDGRPGPVARAMIGKIACCKTCTTGANTYGATTAVPAREVVARELLFETTRNRFRMLRRRASSGSVAERLTKPHC